MKKFIDDKFTAIESDIGKIQTKPNMYISYTGRRGVLHLAKEEINNMIDEGTNANSPAKNIDILLDQQENTIYISDDGRGMPFDILIKSCTQLQAGSKMTRDNGGGGSAGENGVGLTAINALSERFELISYRYGEKASIKFSKGVMVQDLTIEKIKDTKRHGTTCIFKPNPYFMDKEDEDCMFPVEPLMTWISKIAHTLPEHLRMSMKATLIGKEASINKTFKNEDGMVGIVKSMTKKQSFEPVRLLSSGQYQVMYRGEKFDRFLGIDMAFTYDPSTKRSEERQESFCNFVETIDGGTHMETAKARLVRHLIRSTSKILTEREAKKFSITKGDVLVGLDIAVYVSTEINPEFSGQTKEKVTSTGIVEPIKGLIDDELDAYFLNNPKMLKRLMDIVKTNAKARVAASSAKEITVKAEKVSIFDEHMISNFEPALNKKRGAYRELILMEGESAAGSVNGTRFKEFQATYGLRGYIPNAFVNPMKMIVANVQLSAITTLVRAGLGKNFDLSKVWYDKIIILTDADGDGAYIESLLAGFFLLHMRPLVEDGRLHRALPPLYKLKDKENKYVRNKKEYIEVYEKRVVKHMNLTDVKTGKLMSDEALRGFLMINRTYLEELIRMSTYYATHQYLIEFIAMFGGESDFDKRLSETFPEITYEKDSGLIYGIHEGRYQNIMINKQVNKKLEKLRRILVEGNLGMYYYGVQGISKNGAVEDLGRMSIGQFLQAAQKHVPEIVQRYKGLGEIDAKELRDTTLDPNHRLLIKLTVDSIEKDLERFDILQGDSINAKKLRKELIAKFDIDIDDLDN